MEQFRDYVITDRAPADVERVRYLKSLWDPVRRRWKGTPAEWSEWESGPKGAYNAKDLNRVTRAASYLLTRLAESGYRVPEDTYPACLASVSVEPSGSGTAEGAFFFKGEAVTVRAKPVGMSIFRSWTENGETVSTEPDYTFTADEDKFLTAHFDAETVMKSSIVGAGRVGRAILGRGIG